MRNATADDRESIICLAHKAALIGNTKVYQDSEALAIIASVKEGPEMIDIYVASFNDTIKNPNRIPRMFVLDVRN